MTENNTITDSIVEKLDQAKAEDILLLDVKHLSNEFEYMIICTATSQPHINALTHFIGSYLKQEGFNIEISKKAQQEWSVVDAGNIVIHIMVERAREFYRLENLWQHQQEDV